MNALMVFAVVVCLGFDPAVNEPALPRVLVFSKTAGYRMMRSR